MPPLIRRTMVTPAGVHGFDHKKTPIANFDAPQYSKHSEQLKQLAYVATTDPQELRKRRL
jgi:hypothetical protein